MIETWSRPDAAWAAVMLMIASRMTAGSIAFYTICSVRAYRRFKPKRRPAHRR